MKSTICLAEDRKICEPALKLALLSLNLYGGETDISLFYPIANDLFLKWIERCPQVRLQSEPLTAGGWNVKPQAILRLIDQGYDEVIWLDSDVLVNRNLSRLFARLSSDTVCTTEDALGDDRDDHDALRARRWGLPVGRVLPFGLNTAVLRVTRAHTPLMQRWQELLQSATYQDSQKKEWRQRPVHMLGDQDVLTALLTSEEFSKVPLHILRRGKDIVQFNGVYGYTVAERLRGLCGSRPTFIHSFGGKPWSERWELDPSADLREYIKQVYLDLSPYTLSAKRFRNELECETGWMEPHYGLSRVLRALGLGLPELAGLPVALFMDLARLARSMRRSRLSHAAAGSA